MFPDQPLANAHQDNRDGDDDLRQKVARKPCIDMLADEMINCMENKDSGGLSSCLKSLFLNIESRLKKEEEMPEMEEE